MIGEIGVNDYSTPLRARRSLKEVRSYVPKVIEAVSMVTERLIENGVVDLVVAADPPLGCFGVFLTLYMSSNKEDYDPRTGCLKKLNALTRYHNGMLRRLLEQFRIKYPGLRFTYADYYGAVMRLARHPKRYGFSNGALRVCCGGGGPYNFNATVLCGQPGFNVCKDPSTFVGWDGIHLTEAAYRFIAMGLLRGPFADPPLMSARLH
ncbi:putative GDSL esterase/lipase [Cocos nucifera]|uniref:Putative GDSL esterase/lipase n=1 Tax=Cocos nucifera TaxID=13894 RepID=A0A8K0I4N6_COCNU|nr:putative GDSL esterase/lipase [Cocos nucifera]